MSDLIEKVQNKLNEFDFKIYNHYSVDKEEYIFMVENMLLFVHEKRNEINISFQVTTRPDIVAQHTLILKEIEDTEINIMDSFIYDHQRIFISGDRAFNLVENSIKKQGVQEFIEHQTMKDMLEKSNCFNC